MQVQGTQQQSCCDIHAEGAHSLLSLSSAAVVAAAARSTKASWRALATTSNPEAAEAAAVQRDTT